MCIAEQPQDDHSTQRALPTILMFWSLSKLLTTLINDHASQMYFHPGRVYTPSVTTRHVSHKFQFVLIFVRTMHFDIHWLRTENNDSRFKSNRNIPMWSRPGKLSQGVGGAPSAISLQDATVESSSWPARNTRALALMFAMYSNWVPDNALSMIDWGIQPWNSEGGSEYTEKLMRGHLDVCVKQPLE